MWKYWWGRGGGWGWWIWFNGCCFGFVESWLMGCNVGIMMLMCGYMFCIEVNNGYTWVWDERIRLGWVLWGDFFDWVVERENGGIKGKGGVVQMGS
ncbi:hypothetical protein, partial [Paenibacillus xylanexedens]|uniref:hypothetical protein n=1 Tax=Paenibacillus xylanexedens TaxID=528191 RepID=UPI00119FFC7A